MHDKTLPPRGHTQTKAGNGSGRKTGVFCRHLLWVTPRWQCFVVHTHGECSQERIWGGVSFWKFHWTWSYFSTFSVYNRSNTFILGSVYIEGVNPNAFACMWRSTDKSMYTYR